MSGRRFNDAVDDYAAVVGLPVGLIDNVTDGTNAHLVALDLDGHVLGREADIVDANRQNRIREIFLLPAALDAAACAALAREGADQAAAALAARSLQPPMNPRLAARLADADLIVYAPGTQHSSLFPSYLTAGLSDAIAANTRAVKLLITNIQADAEIAGSSAVDIIERAVFYLKDKGRRLTPTPALVTHYLLNAPQSGDAGDTYVPLGRLDALQDPRLVRVGQYEQPGSGRHDAAKVLGPYVASLLARRRQRRRVAILLHDAGSIDKLAQTLLEMVRGGLADQPVDVTVFCETAEPLDRGFVSGLPCAVTEVASLDDPAEDRRLRAALVEGGFEHLDALRVVGDVQRRRRALADLAPAGRPAGRRVGEPPAVGPRHRGVVPPEVPAARRDGLGEPARQPRAEPGLSVAVRALRLRHLVRCAGRARWPMPCGCRWPWSTSRPISTCCRAFCAARPRCSKCRFTSIRSRRSRSAARRLPTG